MTDAEYETDLLRKRCLELEANIVDLKAALKKCADKLEEVAAVLGSVYPTPPDYAANAVKEFRALL